ncbi:MAG TPA: 5-formyltetrahydrofolate cyclo-ligase, partial [Pyrinomonadaceae bacterium]|nr:5-formyltetrahydrofolate cyclo-ligase [Pyrinomonadaceae bacterium]
MNKAELRREYLERQKTLSKEERESGSSRIADHFFSSFDLGDVSVLHSFVPIEKFNEINTRLIFAKLWRGFPHIETVVPRVDFGTGSIQSLKFTHETELVRNAWNIDEPSHDEIVDTGLIDLVLVPGLAFDRSGHRVGYGKGFYDRFLAKCREDCVKVGLCYFD